MEPLEALLHAADPCAPPMDLVLLLALVVETVEDVDGLLVSVVLGRRIIRMPPLGDELAIDAI
jgi:hypothetical protein